ncbi:MAG: 50S ribosomal protein L6 [Elusimicrobiaceae bacterium]|jgi:large subunit ribosomal protein L6|nr:50S ribosomal protein L6 [Elusimicrobiaceae bacterium]MBT3955244.1 50S ribosomal protein L6 [Elusimicrobiaceae bacterium]MBT4007708.1 50S ribosomal protein L6 [Elusimicrobiaceae bacterium]MBT4402404.1 50S ribosomal protein L6 [Elusimicrobiaceae bacterium]MBT4440399.1 50S ribosomal protein L6 [Elusimicrobiaceae bacterium]
MSRVGKQPILIPDNVKVDIKGSVVSASGPLGNLSFTLMEGITVAIEEKNLVVTATNLHKGKQAMFGTTRARLSNLVEGVSTGFVKTLEIHGLGYRSNVAGNKINLDLGFSHPVSFDLPVGVSAEADAKANTLTIKGNDKAVVGDIAAQIRKLRPPEPYKGSGIRYKGERVQRKAGKAASTGK